MNLASFGALDHTSIFQVDQIFLLQRAQLIQHLVGGVNSVKIEDHQIAHVNLPAMEGSRPSDPTSRRTGRSTWACEHGIAPLRAAEWPRESIDMARANPSRPSPARRNARDTNARVTNATRLLPVGTGRLGSRHLASYVRFSPSCSSNGELYQVRYTSACVATVSATPITSTGQNHCQLQ